MLHHLRGLMASILGGLLLAGCAAGDRERRVAEAACSDPPLGEELLYLRGSMNGWVADEDYAFRYDCDSYVLNLSLGGRQEFKVADAGWSPARTYGAAAGQSGALRAEEPYALADNASAGATGNLEASFAGAQAMRLQWRAGRPWLSIGSGHVADPGLRLPQHPTALSLRFDSRDLAHKQPFGAIAAGGEVDFRLLATVAAEALQAATLVVERRELHGNQDHIAYLDPLRLPMQPDSDGQGGWHARHRFAEIGVYGYWFELLIDGERYVLHNNRDTLFWTRERGLGGPGVVDFLPVDRRIRRFRQTVHTADFRVPEWAPDIVYYYIFPERFRNGDPGNDPRPGDGSFRDQDVEVHADWNDRPWLNGSGDGSDAVYSNDFFGGDLDGIVEKLDEIADLGANTLYLTPIFRAASNHKYDTGDYHQVDPAFGGDAAFDRLIAATRARGMRVILDVSLNHSGSDSIYFDRYGKFPGLGAFEGGAIRAESPWAGWYRFDPAHPDPEQRYQGWSGVRDLPEFDKSQRAFRDFAYGPQGVMQYWLDRGAAGWRMDVAPWVADDFWREWRQALRARHPDALTVAETWFDASKHLLGDMFDSTMNYIFRNAVLEFAAGGRADLLYRHIEAIREAYPAQALAASMNLLSTHDQARSLHVLGDHGPGTDPALAALARQRFRLALLWQMTFPGAPAVFYGDEVGVTGGDDPYNRVTWPWPELGGQPDLALRGELRRLIHLRHAEAVLRRGSLKAPLHLDANTIVWLRRLGPAVALIGLNNAAEPADVQLELPGDLAGIVLRDALAGGELQADADGRLVIRLPARYGVVLIGHLGADADDAHAHQLRDFPARHLPAALPADVPDAKADALPAAIHPGRRAAHRLPAAP